jgi:CBS-domain-containing membrane protein
MGKKTGSRAMGIEDLDGAPRRLGEVAGNGDLRMRTDTRLATAWTVFLDRELQWITVVDDGGRPVGTLLRRDLADAVLDEAPTVPTALLDDLTPPPEVTLPGRAPWPRGWRNEEAMVEDIMRGTVNTLPASASLQDAAAVFEVAELSEVVVVDDRGRMLGLVAGEDLVPYLPPGRGPGKRRSATRTARYGMKQP